MSDTAYTYNFYHLGDNLIFLHLLRVLAKQHVSRPFVHFCHACHIPQLQEMVSDLPNILLVNFESPLWGQHKHEAVSTWKNESGYWEASAHRWDWSAFTLDHHDWIAMKMGFDSPLTRREQLLFDYPALHPKDYWGGEPILDYLIINGEPNSGQFSPMRQHGTGYLTSLIQTLAETKSVFTTEKIDGIPCTREGGMSITAIGRLAVSAKNVIGVMTGPFFPCINVHRNHVHKGRKTIALLDNGENLNMPGITQCANVEQVREILKREGVL